MKLKNKKTGEIVDFAKGNFISSKDYGFVIYKDGGRGIEYSSLAEFNAEWEDYEEPKEYWFIDAFGNIVQNEITKHYGDEYTDMTDAYENQKQIGNWFGTAEEAELVVEKLKAWKRLKDNGFKFDGWNGTEIGSNISYISEIYYEGCADDMDLLFQSGGEE